MTAYVLGFHEVDRTRILDVGGKGASLGELARLDGIRVPDGFCVTTAAFKRVMETAPSLGALVHGLAQLKGDDLDGIRARSAGIRAVVEGTAIPEDVTEAITRSLSQLGAHHAYAVRSSATAEDLPTASFAGQQDTYLNVIGAPEVLKHIRRCWASLFTERAVAYRIGHGFDHHKVHMAVVVQKLVVPSASGVLFTADPVTSNRHVCVVEACFGLGEALVSGRINADSYSVRNGAVVQRKVATKDIETCAVNGGGTVEQAVSPAQRNTPVLTDAQVAQLARLGRRLEAHFGAPQDVEWCLREDEFFIVQSRPITTLYPIPQTGDGGNRVFISVGHQQMMTDPMKALGLSLFQLTAGRPMYEAGGRLFVDVTRELASLATRDMMLDVLGRADPLLKDALTTVLARPDFIQPEPAPPKPPVPSGGGATGMGPPMEANPAVVAELIARSEASLLALKQRVADKTGSALMEVIVEDTQVLKKSLTADPQNMGAIMAGMNATTWLNAHMLEWLGEKNAADVLAQSAPNNITSEMGLALLDVADVIRPHPEVVAHLQRAGDAGFLEGLLPLDGGPEAHAAITPFLDRYGMRCVGEIDVTRPRWSESPTTLVPLILSNIKMFEPGAGGRRFEQGRQVANTKEQVLLARLKELPDGENKAVETQRMIQRLRAFVGYREYPKYAMMNRYAVYKQALMQEAARLVAANVLQEPQDIHHLTFQELGVVVRTQKVDARLIAQRKDAHQHHVKLKPPRVITSDGEVVAGAYRRANLPQGALLGLAVSSGVVEGRARVMFEMGQEELEAGDILVTTFTDPSWTPVFVAIQGLVTEVGGLMTHGAVIAREYGLPAVVGVEHATTRIKDGQHIRVNGTEGYVEILA